MPYFKEGDLVRVVNWNDDPSSRYTGRVGTLEKIVTSSSGLVNYFVDVNEPGFFFRDLICYEGEIEHVKEETNE